MKLFKTLLAAAFLTSSLAAFGQLTSVQQPYVAAKPASSGTGGTTPASSGGGGAPKAAAPAGSAGAPKADPGIRSPTDVTGGAPKAGGTTK